MKLFVCIFALVALSQAEVKPRHINPPFMDYFFRSLNHGGRIVGGEEATPNEYPSQVALYLTIGDETFFCGGSLISRKYVLTAAHCVENATSIDVVLGAHNIQQNEATQVRLTSTKYVAHEDWDSTRFVNDIAVIELPQEVELNEYIAVVQLPTRADVGNTFAGQLGTAIGWGRYSDSSISISAVLRYVQSNIITNLLCNIRFLGAIQNTHVCLDGSDSKSTCDGDSGGPLFVDGVQIGITSFGIILGCEVGWPAVFTRVTSYLDWIEANSDVVIGNGS